MRPRVVCAVLGLGALIAATFWPLLGADFVYWDDHALYLADPDVRAFHFLNLLTDVSRGGFFPLTRLSLALDHRLFGEAALGPHLVNLLLHSVNVALVFLVARRQFDVDQCAAGIVAAFFAAHPINVEAVAWVSGGRKDLLCALFLLAALASRSPARTVASGVAALMAKAAALPLAPWLWLRHRRTAAYWLVPPTLAALLLELKGQRTALHVAHAGGSVGDAMGRGLTGLALSVSRFLWPRDLAIFYDRAAVRIDAVDGIVLAALACLIASGLRARDRRRWWALGWFALLIAPTLKFVPFGQDSVFNDRYLYLPGVGLLAFVVMSFEGFWVRDRRRAWAAAAPTLLLATFAHAQTRIWLNQETLWLNVGRRYPTSTKTAANLAMYYINENRLEEAEPYARRAILDDPANLEARSNFGVLLTRMGRLSDARDVYLDALRAAPRDARLLNNLGYTYLEMKDFDLAERSFEAALAEAPDFANAREGLTRARGAR